MRKMKPYIKMRNIDIDSRLYYLLNGVVTYHEKDKNKLVDIGQLVLWYDKNFRIMLIMILK